MNDTLQNKINRIDTLIAQGFDLNRQNDYGQTCLIHSILDYDLEMATILLEKGANPNVCTNSGMSPYFAALDTQNNEMINLLTQYGAE